jgi:hypothetical protein
MPANNACLHSSAGTSSSGLWRTFLQLLAWTHVDHPATIRAPAMYQSRAVGAKSFCGGPWWPLNLLAEICGAVLPLVQAMLGKIDFRTLLKVQHSSLPFNPRSPSVSTCSVGTGCLGFSWVFLWVFHEMLNQGYDAHVHACTSEPEVLLLPMAI